MIKFEITQHAFERARERLCWHRRTLVRMMERVFYDGLSPDELPPRIRSALNVTANDDQRTSSRIYGEHLFLFGRDLPDQADLITVYQIPREIRPLIHHTRRSRLALAA